MTMEALDTAEEPMWHDENSKKDDYSEVVINKHIYLHEGIMKKYDIL